MRGAGTRWARRRVSFWGVIAAGALALAASETSAQSVDRPVRVWLGLGLGGAAAQGLDADGAVSFQLTAQWGPHHTVLRAVAMADVGSFPDGSDDSIEELGVLYGRRAAWSFGYVAIAGGVARVIGNGFSGAAGKSRETIGLPVIAEVGLQSTVLGLGIQAFGNLNSVSVYGGVSLFVEIGWMP